MDKIAVVNNSEQSVVQLIDVNMVFEKGGFFSAKKKTHVLRDINLSIAKGEIVAVVGESGCGKTTIGKLITGIYKATSGSVLWNGSNKLRESADVQFIQQDSYAALNPARTIYDSLYAPIEANKKGLSKSQIDEKIDRLMKLVGLAPVEQFLSKYPHQLSGGQRQRVLMARAVSLNPSLIVADEPVSMIDVSLRLSVMNLMMSLNRDYGISFVYITHDLSTARYIAQSGRIVVMYLGEIVEEGPIDEVIGSPKHPYTRALIKAVPIPDPSANSLDDLPLKGMELGSLENRKVPREITVGDNGILHSNIDSYLSKLINAGRQYTYSAQSVSVDSGDFELGANKFTSRQSNSALSVFGTFERSIVKFGIEMQQGAGGLTLTQDNKEFRVQIVRRDNKCLLQIVQNGSPSYICSQIEIPLANRYDVTAIVEDGIVEMFVNGKYALTGRVGLQGEIGYTIGMFADSAGTIVSDFNVCKLASINNLNY